MNIRCCCEQDAAAYSTVLYPNHYSEAPGVGVEHKRAAHDGKKTDRNTRTNLKTVSSATSRNLAPPLTCSVYAFSYSSRKGHSDCCSDRGTSIGMRGVTGATLCLNRPESRSTTTGSGMTALYAPSPGPGPHCPCLLLSASDAPASLAFWAAPRRMTCVNAAFSRTT